MKSFAVILAGCGVYDGAEIHEAVLSLYAIQKNNARYKVFAPDIQQHHVINHYTGKEVPESRNVLIESARIARGDIQPLNEFDPGLYDGLLLPGGFGAAKNLSTFAFDGEDCTIVDEVADAIKAMAEQNKPIGALCISPVIIAKVLGDVKVTIGDDPATAAKVQAMGATHVKTTHGDVVTDSTRKVFTTPCYMLNASIVQIAEGANNIVKAMLAAM
jgi:enhancing lycopene biosynthesis protein 2